MIINEAPGTIFLRKTFVLKNCVKTYLYQKELTFLLMVVPL